MVKPLTVLICCHNGEPYIARCLDSLGKQTLDKSLWKILVLLDGCTDKSEQVLNDLIADDDYSEFPLPEIKVIKKDKKEGLAKAKNFALKQIDTEFIAYQDIDDYSMPQRFEIQLDIMQHGINYAIEGDKVKAYLPDICATQAWDLYPNGQMKTNCFYIGQYKNDHDIKLRLPIENVICHGSVMIRRYALEGVGYYNEQPYALGQEDWLLWKRLASGNYTFYNVPERLYCYSMNTSVPR